MGSADVISSKSNLTELILIGGCSSEKDIGHVLNETPLDIVCQLLQQEWLGNEEFRWVKKYCERHLSSQLDDNNCLRLLKLANEEKCFVLLSQCFRYGAKNFTHIWKTREFLDLTSAELSRLLDQPEVKYHSDLHTALYFWYRKDSKCRQMTYNVLVKRKYSSSKNLAQLNQEIERYTPKTTEKKKNYNAHPTGSVSCELLSDIDDQNSNNTEHNIVPAISCPSVAVKAQTYNPPHHLTHHVSLTTKAFVHAPKHISNSAPENVLSCPALDAIDDQIIHPTNTYSPRDTLNSSLCHIPTTTTSETRIIEINPSYKTSNKSEGFEVTNINQNKPKSSSLPLLDVDEECVINYDKENSFKDINENVLTESDASFVAAQQTAEKGESDMWRSPSNGDSAYESCPSLSDSNNEVLSDTDLESIDSSVCNSTPPLPVLDKSPNSNGICKQSPCDCVQSLSEYGNSVIHDSCPVLTIEESKNVQSESDLKSSPTELYDSCPLIMAKQENNIRIDDVDNFPNSVHDSCPSLVQGENKETLNKDKSDNKRLLNGKVSESCPALDTVDGHKQEVLNKKNTCTVEQILSQCNMKAGDSTKIVNGEKYILVLGKSTTNKSEQEVFMIDLNSPGKQVLYLAEISTRSDACAACYFNFCLTDYLFISESRPKKSACKWYMYNMFESDWRSYQSTKYERVRQSMVSFENRVYAIGGEINGQTSSSIDVHNLKTKRWKTQGNLAIPVSDAPCVISGDKIFVFGGSSDRGESVCVVQCFDFNKKRLRIISILPCCCSGGRAIVVRSKIFIATVEGKLLKFDPKMCECTIVADQPFSRSHFGMVSDGKSIFLLGGLLNKEKLSVLTVYDIASNSWTYTMALDISFTAKTANMINYRPN